MVLLTMTPAIVAALGKIQGERTSDNPKAVHGEEADRVNLAPEPSLEEPAAGKPISHGQIVDLSRKLKAEGQFSYHLDILLRGSRVYIQPPPPKAEPTSEFIALMARLRREEEERDYERMLNPPQSMETFAQRFPTASAAHAFSSTSAYSPLNGPASDPNDDLTFDDINRQITLILNVLVSILACAAAIWMVARWWGTPARLALTMGGSLLVGVAEVVVYTGYLRRIGEAKGKEAKIKEVKEVVKTWVVGEDELEGSGNSDRPIFKKQLEKEMLGARKRRKKST